MRSMHAQPAHRLAGLMTRLTAQSHALRYDLGTASMRIALSTALRATLSTILPLVLLPHTRFAASTYPAVLGALATSLVDLGGPYRSRLLTMLTQAVLGATLLRVGGASVGLWWLAAAVVAAIGIGSGMARAVGQTGASLGTNLAVALLVGVQLGEFRHGDEGLWAISYCAGGLWTLVVALAFWELRPYRRLAQEVASVWDAVASLLEATLCGPGQAPEEVERRIVGAHRAVRTALEQSRESLGELRSGAFGPVTALGQLSALLESAATVAAYGVSLCESSINAGPTQAHLEQQLAAACRAIARALTHAAAPGTIQTEQLQAIDRLQGQLGSMLQSMACRQALQHLEEAQRALKALFAVRSSLFDLMRLQVSHRRPRGALLNALRTNATPRSPTFRHAVRFALIGAFGTALLVALRLPHGIWLPVTALAILQPEYGGTVTRAAQRSLGTVAGALIASVLLATVRGGAIYYAALGALLFETFLLIRRNYGYGIAFLTPLVILLLGITSANPWIDLAQRVGYTMAGAVLALAAGYLLWPQWERDRLRNRLVSAIDADRSFLEAVLQTLCSAQRPRARLEELRRQAELALTNADAGVERLVREPASSPALFNLSFAVLIYLHRLCRHAIALSAHAPAAVEPQALERLLTLTGAVLNDVRRVIAESRSPVPWPSIGQQLVELTERIRAAATEQPAAAPAATLLDYVAQDLIGLLGAAGYAC